MKKAIAILVCLSLAACGIQSIKPSSQHLLTKPGRQGAIPQPVRASIAPPLPKPAARIAVYSVSVYNVPVQELLYALARDAGINIDIHPGINGVVTINAINQSLPQILSRISEQVDMRYEMEGADISVMPDTPYLLNYKVDYLNMSRDTNGSVAIITQIATPGAGVVAGGTGTATAGINNSTTSVTNIAKNRFWETLIQNIKDLLHETDKILPEGSSETIVQQAGIQTTTGTGAPPRISSGKRDQGSIAASPSPATLQNTGTTVIKRTTFREASSVIANPEAGIISIRATSRQHKKIQEFLDRVMQSVKRQVLIEATVVEVQLSDAYQQGINWAGLANGGKGWSLVQSPTGGIPSAVNQSLFVLSYTNPSSSVGNLSATVSLLESFGKVKVLSSPQVSVLNNQTALLKVVDNRIYFTIQANTSQNQTTTLTTYTTTVNSVPVGFVMDVTPEIGSNDSIIIDLRPTISRILGYVSDPNPSLPATVKNLIPEIQTREMESVIRVNSGQIAVLGGLMQDSVRNADDTVPGLFQLRSIGGIFSHRNDTTTKSELVIFLRPIVIKDASLDGDFAKFRSALPDRNFFDTDGN